MQPLKKTKDALLVLRLDAEAVIIDAEKPVAVLTLRRNAHNRGNARPVVFNGVTYEILEKLLKLRRLNRDRWQGIKFDFCTAFRYSSRKVRKSTA